MAGMGGEGGISELSENIFLPPPWLCSTVSVHQAPVARSVTSPRVFRAANSGEVEEVEDPPIPPVEGDSDSLAFPPRRHREP